MTVQFEHEEMIDAPLEVVFDLSVDLDAHQASMARSKERAIGGSLAAGSGSAKKSRGAPGTSASPSP
jgi:hypothetical protein